MVEATGLPSTESRSLQCHYLHTKFHPNPPIGSKIIKGYLYAHLRNLEVRHFGMAEAMKLKNVTSRSPSMASPAYNISLKSTSVQKLLVGDTQTDRLMI
jgi:hypothetical protein